MRVALDQKELPKSIPSNPETIKIKRNKIKLKVIGDLKNDMELFFLKSTIPNINVKASIKITRFTDLEVVA